MRSLNCPTPASANPPYSGRGFFRITFTAPPVVLRPNSVPCGPRSTSTRSTSKNAKLLAFWRAMNTSSTYVPTGGSKVAIDSVLFSPRIEYTFAVPRPVLFEPKVLGISFTRSRVSWTFSRSSCASVNAVTAIGTSWIASLRRCAVTTPSSSPDVGAACAATAKTPSTPAIAERNLMFDIIGLEPPLQPHP